MVNLKITKLELQQLILWGSDYKEKAKKIGIPFDIDEEILLNKLKQTRGDGL